MPLAPSSLVVHLASCPWIRGLGCAGWQLGRVVRRCGEYELLGYSFQPVQGIILICVRRPPPAITKERIATFPAPLKPCIGCCIKIRTAKEGFAEIRKSGMKGTKLLLVDPANILSVFGRVRKADRAAAPWRLLQGRGYRWRWARRRQQTQNLRAMCLGACRQRRPLLRAVAQRPGRCRQTSGKEDVQLTGRHVVPVSAGTHTLRPSANVTHLLGPLLSHGDSNTGFRFLAVAACVSGRTWPTSSSGAGRCIISLRGWTVSGSDELQLAA